TCIKACSARGGRARARLNVGLVCAEAERARRFTQAPTIGKNLSQRRLYFAPAPPLACAPAGCAVGDDHMNETPTPEECRQRAADARKLATITQDARIATEALRAAEEYERLAQALEAATKPPKSTD